MSFELQESQNSESTDNIRTTNIDTFGELILRGKGPIVVEFMSYGCSYCRALEPVLQQVAEMGKSKGKLFRVNVAVEQELADRYAIESTPTLMMFLNGQNVGRAEGPTPTVASVLTAITQPFRAAQ
jgi:thioredoxin 1